MKAEDILLFDGVEKPFYFIFNTAIFELIKEHPMYENVKKLAMNNRFDYCFLIS